MSEKRYRSLGIDQGYASCGYAVIEMRDDAEPLILCSGTIKTQSTKPLQVRLLAIKKKLSELATAYEVDVLGCEKLFFNPSGGGRNKSAAIINTSMATGVCYMVAAELDLPISDYTPGTIKKQVAGSGRATKDEVSEAIGKIANRQGIMLKTDHEADAIGIGIAAASGLMVAKGLAA